MTAGYAVVALMVLAAILVAAIIVMAREYSDTHEALRAERDRRLLAQGKARLFEAAYKRAINDLYRSEVKRFENE